MDDNETQPIFETTIETRVPHNRARNFISLRVFCGRTFGRSFKWLCLFLLLVGQVIGLTMFTAWAVDCFFREFHTTPTCKHFVLFPSPGIFESVWLFMRVGGSLFLIFHVSRRSPAFQGIQVVIRHLIRKKYFYKIIFVLFVVSIYDLVVILDRPNALKTVSYMLFMVEKVLEVTLMFLVNFLSGFWNSEDVKLKWWAYKIALVVYSVESYLLALLGSTIAVYKVLTVSEPQSNGRPGVKSVVDLMLLITNNGFRYFIADFFLSKLFDESRDILGSAHGTKKITESIGVPEVQRNDVMLRATPVQEFPDGNGEEVQDS